MRSSILATSTSAIPKQLVNSTISLAEFVANKIEKVADGLSGKNADDEEDDKDTATFILLKTHFNMMEKLRKSKPINYKNLAEISLKLTENKDKEQRTANILKAFKDIPPPTSGRPVKPNPSARIQTQNAQMSTPA